MLFLEGFHKTYRVNCANMTGLLNVLTGYLETLHAKLFSIPNIDQKSVAVCVSDGTPNLNNWFPRPLPHVCSS